MRESEPGGQYIFDDFRLDTAKRLLFRGAGEEPISLTRKAFDVLQILVENHGKIVFKEDLMARVWADSFVEESNLTQTISVLRKKLGENPNQHRFIVTESGKGYRFVARVGKSEEDPLISIAEKNGTEAGVSENGQKKRRILIFSLVLLAAISLGGAAFFLRNDGEPAAARPSSAKEVKTIAVLPFRNFEPNPDDKLLGIGMADAVINKLSRLKSLVVRQTDTVVRYADAAPEAVTVGKEINVDAVLEGNIQKAGGRIRVSVRLFRVSDGALLWADSFDESEKDIFALQDSISEKVARSLSLELNADEREQVRRRYTENLEAYHLYTKGRFFWNSRSSDDLRKSIAYYEQAIAKDENYALAYSGLAETYVLLHTFSQSQDREAFPKAKRAAEKALSLDENLVEARTALALYKEQFEWDWPGAETEFRRAIASNPHYPTAHQWFGEFLAFFGRTEESIAEMEKAVELDPLSLSTNTARAFPYLASRDYDRAIEKVRTALEMDRNFPLALYYLGRSLDGRGDYKNAIVEYRKAVDSSGRSSYFISAMIRALIKNDQVSEAKTAFAEIEQLARKQQVSKYVLARSLIALGERERALAELEKALDEHDSLMIVLTIDQGFDDVRNDSRFREILKKMRL
ncbi:MAG: winged helix-turn-helix domain-containing protein [Acidobacteria bacterium]|nr:winged helix-turn-helix domain-containing protein [Acidobacteriota bacterium]